MNLFFFSSLSGSQQSYALGAALKSVLVLMCLVLGFIMQSQAQLVVVVEEPITHNEDLLESARASVEPKVVLAPKDKGAGLSGLFFTVYPTPTDEILHLAVYAPAILQAFDIQDQNQQSLFYCSNPYGSISAPTIGPGTYYMVVHTNQGSARKAFTVVE